MYTDHIRVRNYIYPLLLSYHNNYKFIHVQEYLGGDGIVLVQLIARGHLF